MNIKLIHGDCLEVMPTIESKSVDMILCDLPYQETGNKWDFFIDPKRLWAEYERIIKDDGVIVLTGTFKFGVQLYLQAPHLYKYDWVWQKENGTNIINANRQPIRIHEQVFVFGKQACTYSKKDKYMKYFPQKTKGKPYSQKQGAQSESWKNAKDYREKNTFETVNLSGLRFPKTIQYFCRDRGGLHPTQKPTALFEYLIKTYTNEGDLVLDNCAGSFTTAEACFNTNRKAICIEKELKYYEIGVERMRKVKEKQGLFANNY